MRRHQNPLIGTSFPFKKYRRAALEVTGRTKTLLGFRLIFAVIILLGACIISVADELQDATSAYSRGDYSVAFNRLRKLADTGDANAETRLGQMYWNGQAVEQDFSMAARLYLLAAQQGYAKAQVLLGQLYFEGIGVAENDVEAANWFRAAAEQHVAAAESILAFMYRNGRGVKQSDTEAAKWFRRAADQGDANAQWRLGDLYRLGQGVPQDYVLAHMWFNLSASRGDTTALVLRDLVAKLMTKEQIAEAQRLARDWKPPAEPQK
jgi:hypothetical protein